MPRACRPLIFEAMAEGVPVVASRHAGIPEAVEHEISGLLVPPGDPDALAEALGDLSRARIAATARVQGAPDRCRAVQRRRAVAPA